MVYEAHLIKRTGLQLGNLLGPGYSLLCYLLVITLEIITLIIAPGRVRESSSTTQREPRRGGGKCDGGGVIYK